MLIAPIFARPNLQAFEAFQTLVTIVACALPLWIIQACTGKVVAVGMAQLLAIGLSTTGVWRLCRTRTFLARWACVFLAYGWSNFLFTLAWCSSQGIANPQDEEVFRNYGIFLLLISFVSLFLLWYFGTFE